MDFYTNDLIIRAEMQRRLAELQRDARRSVAPASAGARDDRESRAWTREFTSWVAARARTGAAFMARTPSNP